MRWEIIESDEYWGHKYSEHSYVCDHCCDMCEASDDCEHVVKCPNCFSYYDSKEHDYCPNCGYDKYLKK